MYQAALVVKNPPDNAGDVRDTGSIPGKRSSREGNGTPFLFLPRESHGKGNMAGYSP